MLKFKKSHFGAYAKCTHNNCVTVSLVGANKQSPANGRELKLRFPVSGLRFLFGIGIEKSKERVSRGARGEHGANS